METIVAQTDPGMAAPSAREAVSAAPTKRDAPSATGLLLAAVALGAALQVNFGQYHPLAMLWLTVALLIGALSIRVPRSKLFRTLERKAPWAVGIGLLVQFVMLLTRSPGATGGLAGDGTNLWPFRAGVIAAAALVVMTLLTRGRLSRACLVAVLLIHGAIGVWVLRAAPNPGVDVILFQRDASQAMLNGENPYAITFPSPYAEPSKFYGPGVVRDGRLMFGYPYPPLSLLMAVPGHLFGDVRYAQLVAITAAGGLIALARPGRLATAAAAVLLFTPRGFFVLEAGWTEPFAALLLAATVFVACHRPRAVAIPLGLLIAVKQYVGLGLFLVPLLPAGMRQKHRTLAWRSLAVAAAVTLPIALWDLPAFLHSAVLLQFHQPFREDALSYTAGVFHATGRWMPAWLAFVLIVPVVGFCLRRCPRTPAGFAAALGLVCLVFFALSKQAFCNYYYFVIAALCCAAAASSAPDAVRDLENSPVSA